MTTELLRHQLACLGWKVLEEGQQGDYWYVLAASCGHTVLAFADGHQEVESAARSLVMKLTREGVLRLPRP